MTHRARLALAPLALSAVFLGGCSNAPLADVLVHLTDPSGQKWEYRVTCHQPGPTEDMSSRCAELVNYIPPEDLATDDGCVGGYGDNVTEAEMVGSIRGEEIERSFNRADACAIDDWDSLVSVFTIPSDAEPLSPAGY